MSFGYLLLRPFAVLIYHTGIKKSNERVHKMETDMALSWLSELGKRVFGSMDGLFYTLVAFVVIERCGCPWNRQEDRYFCAGVPK